MTDPANIITLPLFPLHTVLFPGGPLPLRIFEPRYLDMVSQCMRTESAFGICLIREGKEVGEAAQTYEIGTLATISYWHKCNDGLLGITVRGGQRFRILEVEVLPNHLTRARVELLPDEPPVTIPAEFQPMVDLLRNMLESLNHPYIKLPRHYDNASWVGGRLAELLPLKLDQKQHFLQLNDPLQRLERLFNIIQTLGVSTE